MLNKKVGVKILVVLAVLLSISLSYMVGTMASGQWQGNAKEKAAIDLEAVANSKYQSLVDGFADTMQQAVDNEISNVVIGNSTVIEQTLDAYFAGKLDSLADSEPFQAVKTELDELTNTKISYYQQILDGLFGY